MSQFLVFKKHLTKSLSILYILFALVSLSHITFAQDASIRIEFSNDVPSIDNPVDASIIISCPNNYITNACLEITVPQIIRNFKNSDRIECTGFLKDSEISISGDIIKFVAKGHLLSHDGIVRIPLNSNNSSRFAIKINKVSLFESKKKVQIGNADDRIISWKAINTSCKETAIISNESRNKLDDNNGDENKIINSSENSNSVEKNKERSLPPSPKPIVDRLYPDKPAPQYIGTKIKFLALAHNPNGKQMYYRFGVNDDKLREWDPSDECEWVPARKYIGNNTIFVWVTDVDNQNYNDYDYTSVNFEIIDQPANTSPNILNVTLDPSGPQQPGTPIDLSVIARDSDNDEIYYKYFRKGPSTNDIWKAETDFIKVPHWIWRTFSNDTGINELRVDVLDKHHSAILDDSKVMQCIIDKCPVIYNAKIVPSWNFNKYFFVLEDCGELTFSCNASDEDGKISIYDWHSDKNAHLGDLREFKKELSTLSWFDHDIQVSALDNNNMASDSYIIHLFIFPLGGMILLIIKFLIIYSIFIFIIKVEFDPITKEIKFGFSPRRPKKFYLMKDFFLGLIASIIASFICASFL